jgi:hypothetical protein
MQIYYALFDSDSVNTKDENASSQKSFWTWRSRELSYAMCDIFYGKVLSNSNVWGGIAKSGNYTILYRRFDAGQYKDGRAGHFVILTAWIKTDETKRKDLYKIFYNETFSLVEKDALTKSPVPEPPMLVGKFVGEVASENDSLIPQFTWQSEFVYEDEEHGKALEKTAATWAMDNDKRIISVKFASERKAIFELEKLPEPNEKSKPRAVERGNRQNIITIDSSNNMTMLGEFLPKIIFLAIIGIAILLVIAIMKLNWERIYTQATSQTKGNQTINNGKQGEQTRSTTILETKRMPNNNEQTKTIESNLTSSTTTRKNVELSVDEIKQLYENKVSPEDKIEFCKKIISKKELPSLMHDQFNKPEDMLDEFILPWFSKLDKGKRRKIVRKLDDLDHKLLDDRDDRKLLKGEPVPNTDMPPTP